jgi:hypothetical protein
VTDYYLSAQVDQETTLCISPMTARRLALSCDEVEDESGHFLYVIRGGDEPREVEILARLTSDEAVFKLGALLGLA